MILWYQGGSKDGDPVPVSPQVPVLCGIRGPVALVPCSGVHTPVRADIHPLESPWQVPVLARTQAFSRSLFLQTHRPRLFPESHSVLATKTLECCVSPCCTCSTWQQIVNVSPKMCLRANMAQYNLIMKRWNLTSALWHWRNGCWLHPWNWQIYIRVFWSRSLVSLAENDRNQILPHGNPAVSSSQQHLNYLTAASSVAAAERPELTPEAFMLPIAVCNHFSSAVVCMEESQKLKGKHWTIPYVLLCYVQAHLRESELYDFCRSNRLTRL